MSHRDHVEIGKATNLHYGKRRHGSGGAVAPTYRPKTTYPTIKETRRPTSRTSSTRPPRRGGSAAIAVVALFVVLLLGAGIGGWYFFLRDIKLTVNGQDMTARINTPLANLLADNEYFGVQPGRLLSITGNVIDEQGGVLCTVTYNGENVAEQDFAGTLLKDGDEVAVGNGTDVEEPSHEEEAPLAPGVQKERGGAVQFVSQWGKAGKKTVRRGERSGETVDVEVVEPATDMIVSSINLEPAGGPYIALTFDDGPWDTTTAQILDILKENTETLGIAKLTYDEKVAKVSVVGSGIRSHSGVAAKMFGALANVGINTEMVTTSEIRITALVPEEQADIAMRAIHETFIE